MIPYTRETKATVSPSAVKIIGLGGAGTNMLERIALDSTESAELLVLNTDLRTLNASISREKIQLGTNLTKGLGAGGDPELGQHAVIECEDAVRDAVRGHRIIFLCTGLGGGTGSGAAPIVTRIAREEGAFVVVFATMPFSFEGRRRREQAETALNELAVLANALVTFDNNRMGELVLAKQGVHEAFTAADLMICESIKAVIRLVVRPGLVNIGLDDLVTALRTTRSRCLFGSGVADGKDRAAKALRNALASPLLDQGTLLRDAQSVLVHLSGGENLTLYEIELLMQQLQKYVPEKAHILFGAAIDPSMGDQLSITLISALPEDVLASAPLEALAAAKSETAAITLEPSQGYTPDPDPEPEPDPDPEPEPDPDPEPEPDPEPDPKPEPEPEPKPEFKPEPEPKPEPGSESKPESKQESPPESDAAKVDDRPFAEPSPLRPVTRELPFHQPKPDPPVPKYVKPPELVPDAPPVRRTVLPPRRDVPREKTDLPEAPPSPSHPPLKALTVPDDIPADDASPDVDLTPAPRLSLNIKPDKSQTDLPFDAIPRGRFQGENPNVIDGEDLDLPPFLRKKNG